MRGLNDLNREHDEKFAELNVIAHTICENTCRQINTQSEYVQSEMPYKTQYILEQVVKLLQERI